MRQVSWIMQGVLAGFSIALGMDFGVCGLVRGFVRTLTVGGGMGTSAALVMGVGSVGVSSFVWGTRS